MLLIDGLNEAITTSVDFYGSTLGNGAGALAAGCFFLAIAYIIWIFLLGAEENTTAARFVQGQGIPLKNVTVGGFGGGRSNNSGGGLFGRKKRENGDRAPTQPVVISAPSGAGSGGVYTAAPVVVNTTGAPAPPAAIGAAGATAIATDQVYNFKAKALYSCKCRDPIVQCHSLFSTNENIDEANPEDPNEISFTKNEILDILDNKGKWWQARRTASDGKVTVGIVPSNYLQLQ